MKLKHIFENAPQQPKMTVQQVLDALKDFNFWTGDIDISFTDSSKEKSIRIDDQGLIHIDSVLSPEGIVARMPLQLQSVKALNTYGLKTLEGLPRRISNYLDLTEFMGTDLTTANLVTMGSQGQLSLSECPNLTSLKGIENFRADNQEKIRVIIVNCDNLAFDPFDYTKNYTFEFMYTIPPRVPLVQAIALTSPDQINFVFLDDEKLEKIINEYRGQSENMPHLALKLSRAGYRGHAGLT